MPIYYRLPKQVRQTPSIFIVPGKAVKNRMERLVVLNQVALSVVDSVRGKHEEYVLLYQGKPVERMNKYRLEESSPTGGISSRKSP